MSNELKIYFKIIGKLSILVGGLIFFDCILFPRVVTFFYNNLNANEYCFEQPADIFVLGDSHTQRSIDPNFTKIFNVSNFSKTGNYLPISYAIYSAYRESNPAPKFAILSVETWTFRDKPFLGNYFFIKNKSYGTRYIQESMGDLRLYVNRLKNFNFNMVEHSSFFTEFLLRLTVRSLAKTEKKCINGKSYVMNINPVVRENDLSQVTRPSTFKVVDYDETFSPFSDLNRLNLHYFELLLKKMTQDGVRVVLIETPRFIGAIESVSNIEKFYRDIEVIVKNYKNVVFLKHDFFKINSQDPHIFYDGVWGSSNSHLNGKGAVVFNERLYKWIQELP